MHLSTVLLTSLSLVSGGLAQSVVSINVVSTGAAAAAATSAVAAVPGPTYSNSTSSGSSAASQGLNATVVSSSGSEKVWVVKVGSANGTFIFAPNSIVASAGDWVQFQFEPRNHSVVTSAFDSPCVPNVNSSTPANTKNVFYSGFMPTADQGLLTYTVPVVDQSPVWFYCSQQQHCQAGMVGVINPPSSGPQTLQAFIAAAANAPANLSPDLGSGNSGNGNAVSSAAPSATGSSNGNLTMSGSAQVAQSTRASSAEGLVVSFGLLVVGVVIALGMM